MVTFQFLVAVCMLVWMMFGSLTLFCSLLQACFSMTAHISKLLISAFFLCCSSLAMDKGKSILSFFSRVTENCKSSITEPFKKSIEMAALKEQESSAAEDSTHLSEGTALLLTTKQSAQRTRKICSRDKIDHWDTSCTCAFQYRTLDQPMF
jgi:hypothetical protein